MKIKSLWRMFWPSTAEVPGGKVVRQVAGKDVREIYGTYAVGRNAAKRKLGRGKQRRFGGSFISVEADFRCRERSAVRLGMGEFVRRFTK